MGAIEKQKMCDSCEGRIPLDAEICPYCASDQANTRVKNSFQAPLFQNQTLEDSLTSLYTPPYQGRRPNFSQPLSQQEEIPMESDLYSEEEPAFSQTPIYKEVTEKHFMDPLAGATVEAEEKQEHAKSSFWPSIFLLAGTNFFILGLLQFFFSKNGIFRLEWDASHWFFYCLFAAPLLFFGIKKLKELD